MRAPSRFLPSSVLLAGACVSAPSDPSPPPPPPALPRLTAAALPDLPRREGEVGTTLPRPIRVEVRLNGVPVGGARVTWGPRESLHDVLTQTDGSGIASARWTLGPVAGAQHVWATVEGVAGVLDFEAMAVAGPPVSLEKLAGDGQRTGSAAVFGFEPLVARAVDRFGNLAPSGNFQWSVESGPVELAGSPFLLPSGMDAVSIRGTGQSGTARVVVTLDGRSLEASYALELAPAEWEVGLVNTSYTSVGFRSHQNLSLPAVDTLPLGGTMVWKFQDYWDVVSGEARIVPLGPPGFPDCSVSGPTAVFCRVTFSTPGTYRYALSGPPVVTGTIVVLP